ncbi:hypothetical protein N7493_006554 [Penicillium malachiteum]|uniref:Uncharacterized protein n=1 Tax=Penicillium malachiteum TaxID=1324776 RepID=A0AAD6HL61_9EURO|nr:hypothetical protein N7493_006554 [Penicillium malachiteum]
MDDSYSKDFQPDHFDLSGEFGVNYRQDGKGMTKYALDKETEKTAGRFYYQESSSNKSYQGSDTGNSDTLTCICNSQKSPYCVRCVEWVIDVEFSSRKFCTEWNNGIHHYNIHGEPVYVKSMTSAEESLAVILSKPKLVKQKTNLLMRSVLNRAHTFLDPVILYLDRNDQVSRLRGSELMEAAKERVYKYYSPHGTWVSSEEFEVEILLDCGDPRQYQHANVAIANGFLNSEHITKQRLLNEQERPRGKGRRCPRKMSWKPSPSPLKES